MAASKKTANNPPSKRLLVEELEPRLLLSADLSFGLALPDEPVLESNVLNVRDELAYDTSAVAVDLTASKQLLNIVLVDSTLSDSDILSDAATDGAVVIEYDGANESMVDVLARVTTLIEGSDAQIGSLSIFSHGSGGRFELGNEIVSAYMSEEQLGSWHSLAGYFAEGGNLYVYGCNVVDGSGEGQQLLDILANITGADVFGSTDTTGAGGDWELEAASTGDSEELEKGLDTHLDKTQVAAYEYTLNKPTAADNTIVTLEDTAYTFTVADFLFSDVDGDSLDRIQITELETVGALQLSGVDVTLGQEILVADITAGNLKFVPVPDQNGGGYDSFEFRVHDGTSYSAPASMTTIMTAGFDVDAEGFSYADDTFGTSNPGWAAGTYEAAGGLSGGGLRVYLAGGLTGAPVSGGWSDTFNLAQAETVTVSLQYRMIFDGDFEPDEYGEIILDIDGTRYGADLNNSLFHQAGDGNGGADDDTGWLYAEFDIALSAGNHTLTVGAYNNKATDCGGARGCGGLLRRHHRRYIDKLHDDCRRHGGG